LAFKISSLRSNKDLFGRIWGPDSRVGKIEIPPQRQNIAAAAYHFRSKQSNAN